MSSKKKGAVKTKITLHNFFTPNAGSSTKEMGKPRTLTKSRQPEHTQQRRDIIIIDSDSDDDPVEIINTLQISPMKKRRRLSQSSGEVEFIDPPPLRRKITRTVKKELRPATSLKAVKVEANLLGDTDNNSRPTNCHSVTGLFNRLPGSSTANVLIPPKSTKSPVPSFGAPSLLKSTTTNEIDSLSNKTLSFGTPFLLRPRDAQASHMPYSSIDRQVSSTKGEKEPSGIGFSNVADEDWGTGDDETSLLRSSEDEVVDYFDEAQIKLSESHPGQVSELQTDTSSDSAQASPFKATKELTPMSPLSPTQTQGPLQLISCDGKTKPKNDNAFNLIMTSHKENEAWKEASVAEDRNFRPTKGHGGRRKAPFYKVLQGMPIAVDAFRYGAIPGVTAYFLTHAHSDHYTNLSSTWKNGPIYCSEGTANLIIHMLSVDRQWVYPLPMDTPTIVPNTKGVRVTLIEANHCPGSCLFYFEGPQTINSGDSAFRSPWIDSPKIFKYLHCGDFRASPRHVLHPEIRGKKIDHVYLDTTYLDPKYSFPPQPLVISACAELARILSTGQSHQGTSSVITWLTTKEQPKPKPRIPKLLFIVGTYSIGKERIVKAIAQALKTKIYCDSRKAMILRCQSDLELNELLTSNPLEANVHVVPLGLITSDKLKPYLDRFKGQFDKAVGFRPTGWTYTSPTGTESLPTISTILSHSQHRGFTHANLRPARNSTSALQLYPIPYSEHSSFYELTCFAMSFEWDRMIATVNVGSESSRAKMSKWVTKWELEKKKGKVEVVPHRHPDYW